MKQWRCTVCGYIHTGAEPPAKCPVCGADKSLFVPLESSAAAAGAVSQSADTAQSWQCSVCGHTHHGDQAPTLCPVCGSDQQQFTRRATAKAAAARVPESRPAPAAGRPMPPAHLRWLVYPQILTRLHGHPIAVHIPNGVLPAAVLFMLLSLFFRSSALAAAAKYNIFFVTLAMPAVIISGLGDWINRYGGHMTHIFGTKMVCAGIVSVLCLTLSLWWLVDPQICVASTARIGTFIVFHLLALAAAAVAGWYGGKLVFRN